MQAKNLTVITPARPGPPVPGKVPDNCGRFRQCFRKRVRHLL